MKTFTIALILIIQCVFASVEAQDDVNDGKAALAEACQAIRESNSLYFQSFVKNDSSIFIDRYAKDACILAPNAQALCGHDAAAKFFRSAYDTYGLRNGKFITLAVYGDAREFVTEEGLWESYDKEGKLFDNGKFLVVWKKTSDGWKMYRDSFSSDRANQ